MVGLVILGFVFFVVLPVDIWIVVFNVLNDA